MLHISAHLKNQSHDWYQINNKLMEVVHANAPNKTKNQERTEIEEKKKPAKMIEISWLHSRNRLSIRWIHFSFAFIWFICLFNPDVDK